MFFYSECVMFSLRGQNTFLVFKSQIANGKPRRGTFAPHHSIGDVAAYATRRGGSGKCIISVLKARRHCGMPRSRAQQTPLKTFLL
jgi:hypothetical protein